MTSSAQIRFDVEMSEFQKLDIHSLRDRWRQHFNTAPPKHRSKDLLLYAFAYRLQSQKTGDLTKALKRRIGALATEFEDPNFRPAPRDALSQGTALIREWNNRRYVVVVEADGFRYLDKTYPSLTAVTRAITGVHQNGRRFFKLDKARSEEAV
jgi:hypothetical protein